MADPVRGQNAASGRIEAVDGVGLHRADRLPRVGRHVSPGTRRRSSSSRRRPGADGPRLHLRRHGDRRRLIRDSLADVVRGRDAMAVPGAWSAMVAAIRNLGRPGDRLDGDLRRRLGALGPEGQAARPAAGHAPRGGPRRRAGLRQRRVHVLLDRAAAGAARRLGRGRHPAGQDEDRHPPGRRPRAGPGRPRGDRRRTPNSSSTPTAPTAASRRWPRPRRSPSCGVAWFEEPVSSDDLEGLRLIRDRAPAGMDDRRGRVRIRPVLLPPDARSRGRRRAPGRRDPLRRGHRVPRVGALCEARGLALSAHCAPSLHAHAGCASPQLPPPRVFPRPRPDRARALRRRAGPGGRRVRPDLSRPGLGLEFKRQDAARFAV